MSVEKLFDGITQVSDDLIKQAEQPCVPRRRKKNWLPTVAAAAACALLLVVFPRMMSGSPAEPETPGAVPSTPSTPSTPSAPQPPTPSAPAEGPEEPYTVYMDHETGAMPAWTLHDTFAQSSLVAVCTITGEEESFYIQQDTGTRIYSQKTAVVERVILGEAPEIITIRQPGGTVGLRTEVSESQPTLRVGTTYLLFLMKPDAGMGRYTKGDYYMIVSGRNGSYEQMPQGHFASTKGVKLEEADLVVPEGVEPYSLREDRLNKYAKQLSGGRITREAYDQKVAALDRYAVILEENPDY